MSEQTHFTVSELLQDGRIFLASFSMIDDDITATVDVFTDATLRQRQRLLEVHMRNGDEIINDLD